MTAAATGAAAMPPVEDVSSMTTARRRRGRSRARSRRPGPRCGRRRRRSRRCRSCRRRSRPPSRGAVRPAHHVHHRGRSAAALMVTLELLRLSALHLAAGPVNDARHRRGAWQYPVGDRAGDHHHLQRRDRQLLLPDGDRAVSMPPSSLTRRRRAARGRDLVVGQVAGRSPKPYEVIALPRVVAPRLSPMRAKVVLIELVAVVSVSFRRCGHRSSGLTPRRVERAGVVEGAARVVRPLVRAAVAVTTLKVEPGG